LCSFSVSALYQTRAPAEDQSSPVTIVVPVTMGAEGAADEEARVSVIGGVAVIAGVIWITVVAIIRRWIITPAYRSADPKPDKDSRVGGRGRDCQGANAEHGN
jgi:hypothetical protein